MIDFKVVQTSDAKKFETQMRAYLNEGYGVSHYDTATGGSATYQFVYLIAFLSKEL